MVMWGIHNDDPGLDFAKDGLIAIGWDELGDLRLIGADRHELKTLVAATYPELKPGAIPVWAGTVYRFAFEVSEGDYVVAPRKSDRTFSIGRVTSDYYWDQKASTHKGRRRVTWLRTDIPRPSLSKAARYEIGSAVTLFRIKKNDTEFISLIEPGSPTGEPITGDQDLEIATSAAEEEPSAVRIEEYSRDFVIDTLLRSLSHEEFEHFTADLLTAMGYRARVTQYSADGGVDVIAHHDPLGLEPPIVKVQCKHTTATIGSPDVQKLVGTLAPGGNELGLFVCLGSYSPSAIAIERARHELRLIDGTTFAGLVLEHYSALAPRWKPVLPLRQVYVVDRDPAR